MNKLDMAHEYAMKHVQEGFDINYDVLVVEAWKYADAMQAEADKRVVKLPDVFFDDKKDEEWQPDWSQAPSSLITHWSVEGNGTCTWWVDEPCVDSETHFENPENPHSCCHSDAPSFNYIGNWQDSLRKRPQ